jgi:hypothetical protein
MGSIAHATKKEPALTKVDSIKYWIGSNFFENGNLSRESYFYKKFFSSDPKYLDLVNKKLLQEKAIADANQKIFQARAKNPQLLKDTLAKHDALAKQRDILVRSQSATPEELAEINKGIKQSIDSINDIQREYNHLLSTVGTLANPDFVPYQPTTKEMLGDDRIRGFSILVHMQSNKIEYQALLNKLHEKQYPNVQRLNTYQIIELLEEIIPAIKTLNFDNRFDAGEIFSGTINR